MQKSEKLIRKKRVVMNIRKLNKIIVIDLYFMLLQLNITLTIVNCVYILIFNVVEFFYQ